MSKTRAGIAGNSGVRSMLFASDLMYICADDGEVDQEKGGLGIAATISIEAKFQRMLG